MKAQRIEQKYLFPNSETDNLRKKLLPFLNYDKYCALSENQEYTVQSIYYDTTSFRYYNEKLEGLCQRRKLRIRGYNHIKNDDNVFLEIKEKYKQYIHKYRSKIAITDLPQFLTQPSADGMGKYLTDSANRFMLYYKALNLMPTNLVIYEREAYFGKSNENLRITFDKNLRTTIFPKISALQGVDNTKYALPNHFILEVKFFGTKPLWIREILQSYEQKPLALSKYTICIDAENRNQLRGKRFASL